MHTPAVKDTNTYQRPARDRGSRKRIMRSTIRRLKLETRVQVPRITGKNKHPHDQLPEAQPPEQPEPSIIRTCCSVATPRNDRNDRLSLKAWYRDFMPPGLHGTPEPTPACSGLSLAGSRRRSIAGYLFHPNSSATMGSLPRSAVRRRGPQERPPVQ